MKLIKGILVLSLTAIITTGCGFGQNNQQNGEQSGQQEEQPNTENQSLQNDNFLQTGDNGNQNQNVEVADKAATEVQKVEDVKQANVMVTNRTAYVAVLLEGESKGEIRKEVEDEISQKVKSTDSSIENVLVSANPDFFNRMTDFGDKVQEGRPVQGLFEEFNEMVQRVFPNAQ